MAQEGQFFELLKFIKQTHRLMSPDFKIMNLQELFLYFNVTSKKTPKKKKGQNSPMLATQQLTSSIA